MNHLYSTTTKLFILVFLGFILFSCSKKSSDNPAGDSSQPPVLQGIDYFGQQPPGNTPVVFSPDFISRKDWYVQCCCFSPDGSEFLFTTTDGSWSYSTLMDTRYINGRWTEPVALFPELFICTPFISYDGHTLYFAGVPNNGAGSDIYYCPKQGNDWGTPIKMDPPINSDSNEWEVSISQNNDLYFSSERPGGYGNTDIYCGKIIDGKYQVNNLGSGINTSSLDECPYIAGDESYMIFDSWRTAKEGGNNFYITFKKRDGTWSSPLDVGIPINTVNSDIYPYVTPDGKYFIYTIRYAPNVPSPGSKLYWVSTSFIDSLRQISN